MKIISTYPINQSTIQDVVNITNNYSIIGLKRILLKGQKEFLYDLDKGTCRFCGKAYPEVSFKKVAHAIPHFTGNIKLYSKFECDACNEYFATFENELANFMLPFNSISGTKGKRGFAKYRQKGEAVIEANGNAISISDVPNNKIKFIDKNLDIQIKQPTYIPEFVYRCLIKIAITILPSNFLIGYAETIKWLTDIKQPSNIKPYMLFSIYPSNLQMTEIVCYLLERKNLVDVENIPYSIFFLSYKNFSFQTYIPYHIQESFNVPLKAFPFVCPTTIDLDMKNVGLRSEHLIDLSSQQKRQNEIITLTINEGINSDKKKHER